LAKVLARCSLCDKFFNLGGDCENHFRIEITTSQFILHAIVDGQSPIVPHFMLRSWDTSSLIEDLILVSFDFPVGTLTIPPLLRFFVWPVFLDVERLFSVQPLL